MAWNVSVKSLQFKDYIVTFVCFHSYDIVHMQI